MKKIDKIFGDKKKISVIYIVLAVGILMLAGGSGFTGNEKENSVSAVIQRSDDAEENLQRMLAQITGVGNVSVMVCYGEQTQSDSSEIFSSSEKRRQIVSGVLIVADGGGDNIVREKIIRATKAALGVDSHKIEVLERNV